MDDVSKMRPVDAFAIARRASEAMGSMHFDDAYRILGLDTSWLEDATLLEVVRVGTARINEYLERAGLPPAVLPDIPDE